MHDRTEEPPAPARDTDAPTPDEAQSGQAPAAAPEPAAPVPPARGPLWGLLTTSSLATMSSAQLAAKVGVAGHARQVYPDLYRSTGSIVAAHAASNRSSVIAAAALRTHTAARIAARTSLWGTTAPLVRASLATVSAQWAASRAYPIDKLAASTAAAQWSMQSKLAGLHRLPAGAAAALDPAARIAQDIVAANMGSWPRPSLTTSWRVWDFKHRLNDLLQQVTRQVFESDADSDTIAFYAATVRTRDTVLRETDVAKATAIVAHYITTWLQYETAPKYRIEAVHDVLISPDYGDVTLRELRGSIRTLTDQAHVLRRPITDSRLRGRPVVLLSAPLGTTPDGGQRTVYDIAREQQHGNVEDEVVDRLDAQRDPRLQWALDAFTAEELKVISIVAADPGTSWRDAGVEAGVGADRGEAIRRRRRRLVDEYQRRCRAVGNAAADRFGR